jgi:hypothetical protein
MNQGLLLIIGLSALVRPIKVMGATLRRDTAVMMMAALVLVPVFALGQMGRLSGVIAKGNLWSGGGRLHGKAETHHRTIPERHRGFAQPLIRKGQPHGRPRIGCRFPQRYPRSAKGEIQQVTWRTTLVHPDLTDGVNAPAGKATAISAIRSRIRRGAGGHDLQPRPGRVAVMRKRRSREDLGLETILNRRETQPLDHRGHKTRRDCFVIGAPLEVSKQLCVDLLQNFEATFPTGYRNGGEPEMGEVLR